VFDAPDAFSACTRRIRSNTPLQALTLLNDQQFYELAQALAERVLREKNKSDADRLDLAFQLCVGRGPKPDEKETLHQLLTGPTPASEAASSPTPQRIEAWTTVARVLLNLDETITRE